jgi:hypothetical protein
MEAGAPAVNGFMEYRLIPDGWARPNHPGYPLDNPWFSPNAPGAGLVSRSRVDLMILPALALGC